MKEKGGIILTDLTIINHGGQRVLTTSQLAESYGADTKTLSKNFERNKSRYSAGKHFIRLEGDQLKDFKATRQIDGNLKYAPFIILWTEKGAWLHAKSLNTDKAWDAYEMLVDEYYRVKENAVNTSQLSPELQMFNGLFQSLAKQELATKQLETKVEGIREVISLNTMDWRQDARQLISKMAQSRGGFGAYKEVNSEIYQEVERRGNFNLSIRLTNKKQKMALNGASKSKLEKVNKVDVIADDKRLIEIYLAVVKDFAIKHGVDLGDQQSIV